MSAVRGEQVRIVPVVNIGNSVSENNDRVLDSLLFLQRILLMTHKGKLGDRGLHL